jgi:hypothetical protein
MIRTNKTEITKAEYLQLIGLKELSKKYNQFLNDIYSIGQKITGEIEGDGSPELYGHTCDYLSDARELDDMLNLLGITVIE